MRAVPISRKRIRGNRLVPSRLEAYAMCICGGWCLSDFMSGDKAGSESKNPEKYKAG